MVSVIIAPTEEEIALRRRLLEDPEFRKAFAAEREALYPSAKQKRAPRILPDLTQQFEDK